MRDANAAAAALPVSDDDAPPNGNTPGTPVGATLTERNALDDLWLNFDAKPTLLPKLQDKPPADQQAALNALAALFMAVPWGAQLPAVNFAAIGAPPSVVHTLVGDTVWQDCWGERQGRINAQNMIPFKMLNILKWITEQALLQLEPIDLERGKVRFLAVQQAAQKRRREGSPY